MIAPFQVGWFNEQAPPIEHLPDFGRPRALGFVIGNSRELWEPFCAALIARTGLRESENPLDDYVVSATAQAECLLAVRARWSFAHVLTPRPIPIQRIAQAAGMARIAPSHLSVHPRLGPWFALRAVVVLDADATGLRRGELANPCESCEKPCLPAFERARQRLEAGSGAREEPVWREFLAVREACPWGRAERYSQVQVEYHYGKRRDRLLAVLQDEAGPRAPTDGKNKHA